MERLGIRWVLVLAAWAWFVVIAEIGSNAITSDFTDLTVFMTWIGLWVAWLSADKPASRLSGRSASVPWLSVPCLLVLGAVVYGSQWPMAVRVWLCEDELRAYAERSPPSEPSVEAPDRIGLYVIHGTDRYAGVTDLMTRHDGFEVGGITYAPNGLPPRHRTNSAVDDDDRPGGYRHLYGPWYRRVIRD